MSTYRRIVFESLGEFSKDVIGTAVVEALHKAYPKLPIIVTSLHPEVWLHHPAVHRVYNITSTPYFYDEFIADGKAMIFRHDPYNVDSFIQNRTHIIEAWCALCGVPYNGELPHVYLTPREHEVTQKILRSDPRPFYIVQERESAEGIPYPAPWARDVSSSTIQDVVDALVTKGYRVLQISPDEIVAKGALRLIMDARLLMCALTLAEGRVLIDSFAHHASAALGLHSIVLWNSLTEKSHGYTMNTNIHPDKDAARESMLEQYIQQFRTLRSMPPLAAQPTAPLHYADAIIKALKL